MFNLCLPYFLSTLSSMHLLHITMQHSRTDTLQIRFKIEYCITMYFSWKRLELTFIESRLYLPWQGAVSHFLKINFLQETKTAHYDLGICPQVSIRFGLIIPYYLLPTPKVVSPAGYKLFWFIHSGKDSPDISDCFQLRGVAS